MYFRFCKFSFSFPLFTCFSCLYDIDYKVIWNYVDYSSPAPLEYISCNSLCKKRQSSTTIACIHIPSHFKYLSSYSTYSPSSWERIGLNPRGN